MFVFHPFGSSEAAWLLSSWSHSTVASWVWKNVSWKGWMTGKSAGDDGRRLP